MHITGDNEYKEILPCKVKGNLAAAKRYAKKLGLAATRRWEGHMAPVDLSDGTFLSFWYTLEFLKDQGFVKN